MATVPNWIAKGVVVSGRGRDAQAFPVTSWRATATQVIVTYGAARPREARFRLDDLREVGNRWNGLRLVPPDCADLTELRRMAAINKARNDLAAAIGEHQAFMRTGALDTESVVASIGKVQRAATKAMADLADLL